MGRSVSSATVIEMMRYQRHEFLNHLQVISGFLQMNKPDRAQAYLQKMFAELEALSRISAIAVPDLAVVVLVNGLLRAEQANLKLDIDCRTDYSRMKTDALFLVDAVSAVFQQVFDWLQRQEFYQEIIPVDLTEDTGSFAIKISLQRDISPLFDALRLSPEIEAFEKQGGSFQLVEQDTSLLLKCP